MNKSLISPITSPKTITTPARVVSDVQSPLSTFVSIIFKTDINIPTPATLKIKVISIFADELSKEDGKTIDNILNETIHILYKDTYLKENEIEEFKKLILSLGKSEVESQERLIDLTVENLKKLTVESKEDIKNKGNLYKKLITFSGICIGIILI